MAGIDWCTLWPDLNYGEACCKPHDAAFDLGGSILDFLAANFDLGACVAALGHPGVAVLMAIGTTAFGWIWWLRAKRRRSSELTTSTAAQAAFFFGATMTEFNGFRGAAKPLDDIDIPRIAYEIGVGEDEMHAVIDVEAAGGPWDPSKRPKALYEPHVAYRLSSGDVRKRLVAAGLAYPKWGAKPYPADSYPRIASAMAIDQDVALKATSWGMGQIMGENFHLAGFDTVQEMVLAFMDDAEHQLQAMVDFIRNAGLDDELQRHDWKGFARGYNGPGYAKNKYDAKLAARFAWWQKKADTPWTPAAIGHNGGPAIEPVVAIPAATPVPALIGLPAIIGSASKAFGAARGAAKGSAVTPALMFVGAKTGWFPAWIFEPESIAAFSLIGGVLIAGAWAFVSAYKAPPNTTTVA